MISDSVANMITIVRNGYLAKLKKVSVPMSKLNKALAEVLKKEGFISDYSTKEDDNEIVVALRYVTVPNSLTKAAAVIGIERMSKPSLRLYKGSATLPKVRGGLGIIIVSTNQGLMTAKEAKQKNVGGELLCKVW